MLARLVPGPLVRFFAARYVAGESLEEGLAKARQLLFEQFLLTTLDLLGEGVESEAQIKRNVATYLRAIDKIASDPFFDRFGYRPRGSCEPTISVKPSAFTTGPLEDSEAPLRRICEHASRVGVPVTIDMEDRRFTEFTIDLSTRLYEEGLKVGTVLQTRLHRTEADLERIPEGMRIRLVIGIYPEPPEVAITDKPQMKQRMVAYADRLLERGARVEFATHDEPTLVQFLTEVAPKAPERCEIQMLLGVPRDGFLARMHQRDFGVDLPVRLYVPFAEGWADATAYLRRRMAETPGMIWLVLRNLLPGASRSRTD